MFGKDAGGEGEKMRGERGGGERGVYLGVWKRCGERGREREGSLPRCLEKMRGEREGERGEST